METIKLEWWSFVKWEKEHSNSIQYLQNSHNTVLISLGYPRGKSRSTVLLVLYQITTNINTKTNSEWEINPSEMTEAKRDVRGRDIPSSWFDIKKRDDCEMATPQLND